MHQDYHSVYLKGRKVWLGAWLVMAILINDVISKHVFARLTRLVRGLKLYHDDFYLGRIDQVVFSGCNLLMTHQYPN